MNAVVGVIGCNGGVGASTLTAALAVTAPGAVLVDLDGPAGGIDVLLDCVDVPGARWSGVEVDGGELDPAALREGLPVWRGCPVLAADRGSPGPAEVVQVLHAARHLGPVVLDLPRCGGSARAAGVALSDLVLLLARADSCGVSAAHAAAEALTGRPLGLVVRRHEFDPSVVQRAVGIELVGTLPPMRGAVSGDRLPRPLLRLAEGVWDGVSGRSAHD